MNAFRHGATQIVMMLAISVGLVSCVTVDRRPGLQGRAADLAGQGVVRIEVQLASKTLLDRVSVGTGFLWTTNLGVTCSHVLAGQAPGASVAAFLGGHPCTLRVLGHDKEDDIAVFTVTPGTTEHVVLPRRMSPAQTGSPIRVLGFSLPGVIMDRTPSITAGIVSAVDRTVLCEGEKGAGLIQCDAVVSEGGSGSPLLDADGSVIGMVIWAATGERAEWRGAAFALPIGRVEEAFHRIHKDASEAAQSHEVDEPVSQCDTIQELIPRR